MNEFMDFIARFGAFVIINIAVSCEPDNEETDDVDCLSEISIPIMITPMVTKTAMTLVIILFFFFFIYIFFFC